jgi:putative endonuclease
MYYVYLIESLSAQEERYVGITADLKQRLREHNQGSLLILQSSGHGS